MKKHIFGLAIFSFIVGAAAIVYGIFSYSEIPSVSVPQYVLAERMHCKMKRNLNESKIDSPTIYQAVFDVKNKRFSWYLSGSKRNSQTVLHFFISDSKGTQYIDSVPAEGLNGDGDLNYSPFYRNIDKLDPNVNFYLIAEVDGVTSHGFHENNINHQVKFDAGKATAVTKDFGE